MIKAAMSKQVPVENWGGIQGDLQAQNVYTLTTTSSSPSISYNASSVVGKGIN